MTADKAKLARVGVAALSTLPTDKIRAEPTAAMMLAMDAMRAVLQRKDDR